MHHWGDFFGMAFLWLVFMGVCGVYALRIAGLLFHQRQIERYYRYRLAATLGAAVRESQSDDRR